jgi:hypothetical protein
VTLEAQAQGTPVIVRAGNAVLEGHLSRGAGGVAVDDYESFAAALDDLWADPAHWRALGRSGQEYVRRHYADEATFAAGWRTALDGLDRPLGEQLRANGRRRAEAFDRAGWREQFGQIADRVLGSPARLRVDGLAIVPRAAAVAGVQQPDVIVPVRLTNRGTHAEADDGPGRTELVSQVRDAAGEPVGPETVTPLPGLLVPGRSVVAMVRAFVPSEAGDYQVTIACRRPGTDQSLPTTLRLSVSMEAAPIPTMPANLTPALRTADAAGRLPDDYVDVSSGRFARLKHWVKQKLLHNFKTAYVDVLSRQQSAFNRQVVTALAELGDGQSALAHAVASQPPPSVAHSGDDVRAELRRLRRQNRRLLRRLARVEAALPPDRSFPEEAAA